MPLLEYIQALLDMRFGNLKKLKAVLAGLDWLFTTHNESKELSYL